MSKHCSKCRKLKSLWQFYKQRDTKSGRRSACIECMEKERKLQKDRDPAVCKGYTKREKEMIEEYLATTHIKENQ